MQNLLGRTHAEPSGDAKVQIKFLLTMKEPSVICTSSMFFLQSSWEISVKAICLRRTLQEEHAGGTNHTSIAKVERRAHVPSGNLIFCS